MSICIQMVNEEGKGKVSREHFVAARDTVRFSRSACLGIFNAAQVDVSPPKMISTTTSHIASDPAW